MERFFTLLFAGLTSGAIYASVALALVLIWRATRVLNFAQGAMAVATTYLAYVVWQLTGSMPLAIAVGIVAGAVLGAGIERLVIRHVPRQEPLNAVLATFGLMTIITAVLGIIFTNEILPFPALFPTRILEIGAFATLSSQDLFVLGMVIAAMIALSLLFTKSPVGLRLRAAAFAPDVARLLGVKVGRTLTIGWALAGAVGSLAGVLVIPASLGLSPGSLDVVFILGFTAAVIGGLDSLVGAVVGGVVVGLISSFTSGYLKSDAIPVITLVILTVVLLIRPDGLFATARARKV